MNTYPLPLPIRTAKKRAPLTPPPPDTYVCVSGEKNVRFFGKFGVLCFLETLVLRFALLHITDNDVSEKNNPLNGHSNMFQ